MDLRRCRPAKPSRSTGLPQHREIGQTVPAQRHRRGQVRGDLGITRRPLSGQLQPVFVMK